jgi:DNA (cytosine-5)-methyltransferase 1
MLNGLDLFSGIGGFTLALSKWVRPIAYCEIEPYCQSVLLQKMWEGSLPKAPIWEDIWTFDGKPLKGGVDIIYGGFPCQDISVAGLGKGLEGKRSRLFFEIVRLAKEIKPQFLFLENVPAILTRGGIRVAEEITTRGYDCRWTIVSAAEVGAPQRANFRWFLLSKTKGEPARTLQGETGRSRQGATRGNHSTNRRQNRWKPESGMDRVANGVPYQMDRIKCLGNAVVPLQAKEAFMRLMGLK